MFPDKLSTSISWEILCVDPNIAGMIVGTRARSINWPFDNHLNFCLQFFLVCGQLTRLTRSETLPHFLWCLWNGPQTMVWRCVDDTLTAVSDGWCRARRQSKATHRMVIRRLVDNCSTVVRQILNSNGWQMTVGHLWDAHRMINQPSDDHQMTGRQLSENDMTAVTNGRSSDDWLTAVL